MQMKEQVWNESYRPGIISSTRLYFQDLFVGAKRMSRKDFWWGFLGISIVAAIITSLLALAITKMPVDDFYWSSIIGVSFAMTLAYYAIAVFTAAIRRLHDRNMHAWWLLIYMIPVIGQLAVVVLLCLPQSTYRNNWPKEI